MQTKPGIAFVHGLWADGSCFSKLILPLQAEGYEVMASQQTEAAEGGWGIAGTAFGREEFAALAARKK